jgi:hypothetical protein
VNARVRVAAVLAYLLVALAVVPSGATAHGCPPNSAPADRQDKTVYCRCVEGTAFPSHRFWVGDRVFRSQPQVQPSAYFKDQ